MMRFTAPRSRALHRHMLVLTAVRFVVGVGMFLLFSRFVFDPARPALFWVIIVITMLYAGVAIFSWTRLYRSYRIRLEEENTI
jgi:drug/metabolite transporter (DMT)-like permease